MWTVEDELVQARAGVHLELRTTVHEDLQESDMRKDLGGGEL